MAEAIIEESNALLARIGQKPGVQSTLVLSKDDGTILHSSGLLSKRRTTEETSNGVVQAVGTVLAGEEEQVKGEGEEMASFVWEFIKAAGGLIHGRDPEDELTLLRVRSRKDEIIVVPNPRFYLVVVHDTPQA